MFICVCNAVSDRAIAAAIDDGARSVADLRRQLRLGTCCGKCVPAAREMIRERTEGGVQRYAPKADVHAA